MGAGAEETVLAKSMAAATKTVEVNIMLVLEKSTKDELAKLFSDCV
jgi:hypothetical protein